MGKTRKKQSLPTEESDVFSDPKVPDYPLFFLPDLTGVKEEISRQSNIQLLLLIQNAMILCKEQKNREHCSCRK
jgi:hypothetical protein